MVYNLNTGTLYINEDCDLPYSKSYDWKGNCYKFKSNKWPENCCAIDVERLDTPTDLTLDKNKLLFLTSWTKIEAFCKLIGIPVLTVIQNNGGLSYYEIIHLAFDLIFKFKNFRFCSYVIDNSFVVTVAFIVNETNNNITLL